MENAEIIKILDILISEYGWTIEYCLKLPTDLIANLYATILERKNQEYYLHTKFTSFAVNAGMSGKIGDIDKVFPSMNKSEVMNEATWKSQLKSLWIKMKKDPIEFENKWANGESINL